MDKLSVNDLTSTRLAKQRGELSLKEDKIEAEALKGFIKAQNTKYNGNIPESVIKDFQSKRKVKSFDKDLKNSLFKVIFRDKEFMDELDRSIAYKK